MKKDKGSVSWFREAAEAGDVNAQFSLAAYLAKPTSNPADRKEAVVWHRKAAAKGHPDSQYALALCLQNGLGTVADPIEAASWFGKAAQQGFEDAAVRAERLQISIAQEAERKRVEELAQHVGMMSVPLIPDKDLIRVGTAPLGKGAVKVAWLCEWKGQQVVLLQLHEVTPHFVCLQCPQFCVQMPSTDATEQAARERLFDDEFSYLRKLAHNNIIRLLARSKGPNGETGFVTEYCERGDLNAILRAASKTGEKKEGKTPEVKKSSKPIAEQIAELKKELQKVRICPCLYHNSVFTGQGRGALRGVWPDARSHQAA